MLLDLPRLSAPSSRRIFGTLKRLYNESKEDDILGLAGELAFRLFLALFPFFIFLAALGGFITQLAGVKNPTDEIINLFGESMPQDTQSVLRSQLDAVIGTHSAGLLSFGVVGSIVAASGGVGTLMKGANRAYNVKERRKIWTRYGISVAIVFFGGLMLVTAFVLFLSGQVYGSDLAHKLGIGGFTETMLEVARWVIVSVLALFATDMLYWAAPSLRVPFRFITPGGVLFVTGWLAMTYVFGEYLSHFNSYNTTYGTLGGVVIILTWFYLSGAILLLGAELNALFDAENAISEQSLYME